MPSTDNLTDIVLEPQNSPQKPDTPPTPPIPSYDFSTPQKAFHSTRVLCDEMGLNYDQKNEICATIYGESEFDIRAINYNKNAKDVVTSTDYSLCQINDRYHIGKGKTFPSVEYVLNNHDKVVKWMIEMYKQGNIDWWIAHKNGSYLRWIPKTSKMWELHT